MTTLKSLDFCIIGAQKSGTTSMFRYLEKHPRIYMAPEKELPFFSWDDLYQAGWPALVDAYFQEASPEQLWGTASPQYMADPRVPERMARANPHMRLIALLRNPIDRAFSHFTMSQRRGMETRSFDQAAADLLQPDELAHAREAIPPDYAEGYRRADPEVNRYYLVWGEYGRALDRFLRHFPATQLLALYMEDMQRDPQAAIAAVMRFLELDTDFQPSNLGKVYHKGGGQPIIPNAWREWIKRQRLFRLVWDRTPPRTRRLLNAWYDELNWHPFKAAAAAPTTAVRQRLAAHFREDVRQVEQLVGQPAPWGDFSLKGTTS